MTVESTKGLRPREIARAVGARAAVCACATCCAADEVARPLLTMVTSAVTDSTEVLTLLIAVGATPNSTAILLMLNTGAARVPPLVALSSRVTVNDAPTSNARADSKLRREGALPTWHARPSTAQAMAFSTIVMLSTPTPGGMSNVIV